MDDVDYRILRHLMTSPWSSNEAVGRDVGVTGGTIRSRLIGMEREGVLNGFRSIPAAEAFGRVGVAYSFAPSAGSASSVTSALDASAAVWATAYDDGSLVVVAYERPGEDAAADVAHAVGRSAASTFRVRIALPRPGRDVVSPLDWRILQVLLAEPRASLADVATRTGLTRRTVQSRRRALVEHGVLRVAPALHEARAHGIVLFELLAMVDGGESLPRAIAASAGAVPFAFVDEPAGVALFAAQPSLEDAHAAAERVAAADGVVAARALVPRAHAYATERLVAWAAAEEARWAAARRRGRRDQSGADGAPRDDAGATP